MNTPWCILPVDQFKQLYKITISVHFENLFVIQFIQTEWILMCFRLLLNTKNVFKEQLKDSHYP